MARRAYERDVFLADLEVFPETLVEAMRRGEINIIRGVQALGGTSMWHDLNPCVRLLQRLASAKRNGEREVREAIIEHFLLHSSSGDIFITDLVEWGLLVQGVDEEGNITIFMPDELWDNLLESLDKRDPDLGLHALGQILGLCSFAKHSPERLRVGLTIYRPVKMVVWHAMKNGGKINKYDAEQTFKENCGSDADRKWHEVIYGDKEKPGSLKLITSETKNFFVINPNAILAMERNLVRAKQLLHRRYRI